MSVFDWFNKKYHLFSMSGIRVFLKISFYFYWKSGTQNGETERKVFCSLIQSPSDCKGLSCTDLNPGAQSLFWISHMGAGSQDIVLSSAAFPGQRQRVEWEAGSSGEKPAAT